MLTAGRARTAGSAAEVIEFARQLTATCQEFVFINELKYLAAGGRVSKAGGFVGDLLDVKPIISPTADGVKKMGVVRSRKGQLIFATEKILRQESPPRTVLLQYSDNEEWVSDHVRQLVRSLLPRAEILLAPLSLTSGVHMGPGTWSLAFAPEPCP
jgi:fatty acid-binding protein DegV